MKGFPNFMEFDNAYKLNTVWTLILPFEMDHKNGQKKEIHLRNGRNYVFKKLSLYTLSICQK